MADGWDASKSAAELDRAAETALAALNLPDTKRLSKEIRQYLARQNDLIDGRNLVVKLLDHKQRSGEILLGPKIDKGEGPSDAHFLFPNGSRLSFSLRLSGTTLIEARFHFVLPDGSVPPFLRFDVNSSSHPDPVREPRVHLHPGDNEIRIPMPVLHPLAILDRIFAIAAIAPAAPASVPARTFDNRDA